MEPAKRMSSPDITGILETWKDLDRLRKELEEIHPGEVRRFKQSNKILGTWHCYT